MCMCTCLPFLPIHVCLWKHVSVPVHGQPCDHCQRRASIHMRSCMCKTTCMPGHQHEPESETQKGWITGMLFVRPRNCGLLAHLVQGVYCPVCQLWQLKQLRYWWLQIRKASVYVCTHLHVRVHHYVGISAWVACICVRRTPKLKYPTQGGFLTPPPFLKPPIFAANVPFLVIRKTL